MITFKDVKDNGAIKTWYKTCRYDSVRLDILNIPCPWSKVASVAKYILRP